MRFPMLALLALASLAAPAKTAAPDSLAVGVFSTGRWYACSDQKIAENIAETFVVQGGDAAMTLFNQNGLVCEVSIAPARLYVHGTVWLREMEENGGMKVVLMTEWNDDLPSKPYYVLTQRTVISARTAQLFPYSF